MLAILDLLEKERMKDMENYDPSARYKAELQPGSYELTINASEVSEDSTGVGETDVDWDSWVG